MRLFSILIVSLAFAGCKSELIQLPTDNDALLLNRNAMLSPQQADVANAIKVMSFNIRHHDANDPQSLDERKGIILQTITDNNPDIVGLQEFADNWFETWMQTQMTSAGYDYYMNESAGFGSPKVIFYKSNRFTRLDEDTFQIQLIQNRSGSWVILLDNATNKEYFVCNSHWSTESSSERVATANVVKDVVEQHSQGLPVIVFGDFNAKPGTPEISIIKNIKGSNNMVCTHSESGPTFHGWDATGTSKLDWIFCSRDLAYINSKVITTSYNGNWPSDHWAITATFIPAIFDGGHYDTNGISASANTRYYFADVTGDGVEEKIYWNPTYDSGHTRVYKSNGNGTFTFLNSNTNGGSESNSTTFYFADVTGDGKADQIYWNPTFDSGQPRVYIANGDGTFSWSNSNTHGGSESNSTTFYFADVTGDGKADKIYWNPTFDSGHTRVYIANGDGTFSWSNSNTNGGSESAQTTFYFADVTGDGKADKIYWNPTFDSGLTRVYIANGDGTFSWSNSNTNGGSESAHTTFYLADVTGDGKADKIYWNPTFDSGLTRVYIANGDGTFSWSNSNTNGGSESNSTTFYFADVTGDGKADKIYWNPTFDSGRTRVYKANGDGTLSWSNSNTHGGSESNSTTFYFADVTGDGKADKIYWNPTFDSGHTRVYIANGDGTFSWSNSNTNGGSESAQTTFYFTDVTGDGKADKIYWNPNAYLGKLKLYRSKGDGTFDDPIYSLRGTSQSSVTQFYFADINGDGKADQIRWNREESPGGHDQGTLKNYFSYQN